MLLYKPTCMLNSITQLTPTDLQAQGLKVVLTVLDNTLIAWNHPTGTPELKAWLQTMADAQIQVVVVSNNNARRIHRAVTALGLPFIARALKPLPFGLMRAKKQLGLADHELVMVGDQLLTDMIAANWVHIRPVLVKPLVETDAWNTRITRFFERFFRNHLKRKYPDLKWRHSLND